jgi:hypothetical protein
MFGNSAALGLEYRFIGYSAEGERLRTDRSIIAGVSVFF